jgi:NAD(P)-dependent dehydrogenase (short-subunit alcohol dehydrogenase family)
MVEVNLLGAMTATEVFLPQLRDGGGDLVNISSVADRTSPVGTPPAVDAYTVVIELATTTPITLAAPRRPGELSHDDHPHT